MARKHTSKILSGGVIILCIVLFCALSASVHAVSGTVITFTISGSVGIDGVTMKGLPDGPDGPVITDQNGNYSVTVDYGWKGTVTPSKPGYTFEPASKTYTKVTSDDSQDYLATVIQFTISGKTGMEGVEMNGLPGNPTTGSDGTYTALVDYDWSGTVMPIKEGFKFTPVQKPYTSVKSNQANQNYTGAVITFVISGSAGAKGVVMNGLPDNPVTRTDGTYSVSVNFGWSGTVTPTLEGYSFEPPSMDYTEIIGSQTYQDYTATIATFTISGTTGMDSVEMKGLPGNPFTDENGYYNVSVDYGWGSRVTPTKPGYTFEPANIHYSEVKSERTEQNYSPTMIKLTISGTTGMEGVTMEGLPGNPVTSGGGRYSVTVDYGWSGQAVPIKEGYKFTPADKSYTALATNKTMENYNATVITFAITGSTGVSGVTMRGLQGNPVTRSDGTYSATVQYGWSGKVTPSKDGYTFDPTEIQYTDLMAPETSQDYIATLLKRAISGKILSAKREPVEEVLLFADIGADSTFTNSNGEYEMLVDHGWRGTITPSKEGYTFNPTKKQYSAAVTRDQLSQAFTATVKMFTISDVVMAGMTPLEGVLVTANNGGGSDTTNAQGRFSVQVPFGWSGELTWIKEGIAFDPPSESYTDVRENLQKGMPEPTPVTPGPTPVTPGPTPVTPGPTPVTPGPTPVTPEPTPTVEVEEPKTELEKNIEKMRKALEELLKGGAPPEEDVNAPLVPEVPLITNTFMGDDLTTVLQDIASMARIPIIMDETVVGLVYCELEDVPLDRALDIVLAGTPYVVQKTPDYYLVCSAAIGSTMFPKVSETRRVRMNYITAEAAVGLLSTAFRQYTQAEIGPPGTSTYTVTVTAPPAMLERIIEDLKQIDHLPSHVLLNARIVVLERGNLLNLGVEWGMPTISVGMMGNNMYGRADTGLDFDGKWPWGIQIGYTPDATFTNSLDIALNMLSVNDEATILSQPQVLAQDGKVAEITVMNEEYYMLTAPETTGYYYSRSELQEITSGTKLNIMPHIGDNNDITLELNIEVSDSIPRARGSDLPLVTRRTATNTVRIKDGGTVALAGLTENRSRASDRAVPGLSKLPLIGDFFKSKNDEKSTREIAVFVTAYIIPEADQHRTIDFTNPSTTRTPIGGGGQGTIVGPVGDDFRMKLRRSLSRPIR